MARSQQAGAKGKGKSCSSTAAGARNGRVHVEVQAATFRRRGRTVARTGWQRFEICLVRKVATDVHDVLITLTSTTVEAQDVRAVHRFLQISTVTTVSILLNLLETTFGGDLMKAMTDFERRVTAWEYESKKAVSHLIKNRSCHQRPGERLIS